jgi:hypothetical protein
MDVAVHWGILRRLREEIEASAAILVTAIVFDVVVLGALLIIKIETDMMVIYAAIVGMLIIFIGERLFLRSSSD